MCVYFVRITNFVEIRYFPQIFSVCKTNIQLPDSQVSRFGAKQAIFVLVVLSSKQVYLKAISWQIEKDMAVEFEKFNLEKTNRTPHTLIGGGGWLVAFDNVWGGKLGGNEPEKGEFDGVENGWKCDRNTTLFLPLHKNLFQPSQSKNA